MLLNVAVAFSAFIVELIDRVLAVKLFVVNVIVLILSIDIKPFSFCLIVSMQGFFSVLLVYILIKSMLKIPVYLQ